MVPTTSISPMCVSADIEWTRPPDPAANDTSTKSSRWVSSMTLVSAQLGDAAAVMGSTRPTLPPGRAVFTASTAKTLPKPAFMFAGVPAMIFPAFRTANLRCSSRTPATSKSFCPPRAL